MFLSRSEKLKGQKNYLKYVFINGLGYSFMAETIIYLMALHFGADNIELGYISSAVYLTGIATFFVPVLFPNAKIINLFFVAWILRGIVGLFYGFVPMLNDNMAVWVIIAVYTVYCLLRNIAYPLNPVIQGVITKSSERGHFSSRVMIILYGSMILSRLVSFAGLSIWNDQVMNGILVLIGLGIVLNTISSFAIKKVPVKERVVKRNLKEAVNIFLLYLKDAQSRIIILLYCGGMSLIVLFNFAIPFLSKDIGVPANMIFIFTVINFVGVIISSRLARPFLDRFGSKPLLTIANLLIAVFSLFWVKGLADTPVWVYFLLGFISMFFIGMVRLLLDRLVVNSIPEDDRVGFSSAVAVVFSVVSLIVGLLGGALANIEISNVSFLPHEFSLTFCFLALLAFINFILSLRLKEQGSLTVNQFLSLVANPGNLKTIHNIDLLKRVNNHVRKQGILFELESDSSHLATQEIKNRLHLATLRDKEMVIRSLFSRPRSELEEMLILEALDSHSWWRQSAIFSLGAYPTPQVRQTLEKIFEEKYPYIKSVAAKSMARINDFSCHNEILELSQREGLAARTYLNLVIALSIMERNGDYWRTIFKLSSKITSHRFVQSLMIIGSLRQNFQPPIDSFFHELNLSEKGGFEALFEELVDISIAEEELTQMMKNAEDSDYAKIWEWCRNRCNQLYMLEPYEILRRCIIECEDAELTPSMTLSGLYLTMQLVKIDEKQNSNNSFTAE